MTKKKKNNGVTEIGPILKSQRSKTLIKTTL